MIMLQEETTDRSTMDAAQAFFTRNGLGPRAMRTCDEFARSVYPRHDIEPISYQGYCSYTIMVSNGRIVQFRLDSFSLSTKITVEAKKVYCNLAPVGEYLGDVHCQGSTGGIGCEARLLVYALEVIPGVNLMISRGMSRPTVAARAFRSQLVENLAHVFVTSLAGGRPWNQVTDTVKGKVGTSLRWRVKLLGDLPSGHLASQAASIGEQMDAIERLPWVLTHGDLVPSNMMVDPSTGHLNGLVDWAEAEWLPFGIGLYGLEEVLGEEVQRGNRTCFEYYSDHEELRRHFWSKFMALSRKEDLEARGLALPYGVVELSRKLGIMLWRGIAFDDGRIDRVVEVGRDDSEIQKLELFLQAHGPLDYVTPRGRLRRKMRRCFGSLMSR